MVNNIEIKVPDIGGAANVDVIEILVKPGDTIENDTPLIVLESDKASMEIPSPRAGKIKNILLKTGDKVSEGQVILTLEGEETADSAVVKSEPEKKPEPSPEPAKTAVSAEKTASSEPSQQEIRIPDIGGATEVDVIDVMVKKGDQVEKDQSLITLEGDKATMDIPSPFSGTVIDVRVKTGDKVSQGTVILSLETSEAPLPVQKTESKRADAPTSVKEETSIAPAVAATPSPAIDKSTNGALISASPSLRRIAREFGVDLSQVKGSGRKSRILKEDVLAYVKGRLAEKPGSGGFSLPSAPAIDFSRFGETETKPLNKIKRLTGQNVHRAWITIPHVTQFDEADITALEAFRKEQAQPDQGYKLTLLAFITKVVCKALAVFPQFNASLDGDNLIYKKYFNIGIAVETPNGLVVPVIKGVDTLSVSEIAIEMGRLSKQAREKGITPADMSGGCFTISSLGGIGGTAFTPIVNSPEVAILGLSRSTLKPVYCNNELQPRLMLPLSLSYDHRVIDGAEAARFTRYLVDSLNDIRRILI